MCDNRKQSHRKQRNKVKTLTEEDGEPMSKAKLVQSRSKFRLQAYNIFNPTDFFNDKN